MTTTKTRSELETDYLASEAHYKELVQQTVSAERNPPSSNDSSLHELEEQRRSALRESSRILGELRESDKPPNDVLLKQMHRAESEIDAVENKIANSDDFNTYPADYAAMRLEQEQCRQQILECQAEMGQIKMQEPKVRDRVAIPGHAVIFIVRSVDRRKRTVNLEKTVGTYLIEEEIPWEMLTLIGPGA